VALALAVGATATLTVGSGCGAVGAMAEEGDGAALGAVGGSTLVEPIDPAGAFVVAAAVDASGAGEALVCCLSHPTPLAKISTRQSTARSVGSLGDAMP
jgi:hypothetical protein